MWDSPLLPNSFKPIDIFGVCLPSQTLVSVVVAAVIDVAAAALNNSFAGIVVVVAAAVVVVVAAAVFAVAAAVGEAIHFYPINKYLKAIAVSQNNFALVQPLTPPPKPVSRLQSHVITCKT